MVIMLQGRIVQRVPPIHHNPPHQVAAVPQLRHIDRERALFLASDIAFNLFIFPRPHQANLGDDRHNG